ncbi:MAG: ABC transporter permease [Acidobacteriia bacterium]|nr:ABC transporter permease [Terriglobia bacterium]
MSMSPRAIIREALRALFRNKMRSTLTVLGITIGIGAVICVVAIGQAGSAQVQEQLNNLGDNFIWIEAGSRAPNGIRSGSHGTKTLLQSDVEAIVKQVPLVKLASANVDSRIQIIYANKNWNTGYRGVAPEWFTIKRWSLSMGAPFTQADVDRASDVCVIGETVRQQLFDVEDPIGKVIRVKNLPCQVMGVLAPRGQTAFGQDQDDTIVMPYTTAQKKLKGNSWLDDIVCSAVSAEAINPAIQQISALLRERHHIRPGQDDDFNIRRPDEFINTQLEARRTFSLLLISIASVSLLVGGIGIMNVMLVSVTERTREIGVRMSIGATDSDVAMQFLGEAVMLSLFGGLIGVAFGVVGSYLVGRALRWPMEIPPQAIVIAALFAVAVGVFFGFYPARKASKLDPIEALRYE